MRANTQSNQLPLGEFYRRHLGTPTAGEGSSQLLESVRVRRRTIGPDGHWGWQRAAAEAARRGQVTTERDQR